MEEAKWYIIHTFSGHENKVANNLSTIVENRGIGDLIQEILVPTEKYIEVKDDGTEKEKERRCYPGYVFVKMIVNDDTWYLVRNIYGCTGFVGPGAKPTPLTEEEIQNIGVGAHAFEVPYKVGDIVKIIDGQLEGFTGKVNSIDADNNSVNVIITFMERETPVDLKLNQVQLAED